MSAIPNSILDTTKKALGLDADYPAFDSELIMYINSVLSTLTQLGAGPTEGFSISDSSTLWSDFYGSDKALNLIPTYVYKKVRLVFDPPSSGYGITALEKMIAEDEFRILVAAESAELAIKFPPESTDDDVNSSEEFPIFFTE